MLPSTYRFRLPSIPVIVFGLFSMLAAQDGASSDRLFREARTAADEGRYEECRNTCRRILQHDSLYHDARVLLARTHAWEQRYDSARVGLSFVLRHDPEQSDALAALADVERWSGNPRAALQLIRRALGASPASPSLVLQQARILLDLGEHTRAAASLEQFLNDRPDHEEARRLLETLDPQWLFPTTLRVGASTESFRRATPYGPWHLGHLSLSRRFGFGLVEIRTRYASRDFGGGAQTGFQFELDAYPRISAGSYLFVNAGYSGRDVFPRTRLGLEYFTALGGAFEGSLGIRHYDFRVERPLQATLSAAVYAGEYWCSLRGYLTSRLSLLYGTGVAQVRRYFSSVDRFAAVTLAAGSSPLDASAYSDVQRLSALRVGLEGQWFFGHRTGVRAELAYEREEYLPGIRGDRFGFGMELLQRF